MTNEQKLALKRIVNGVGVIVFLVGAMTGIYSAEIGLLIAIAIWILGAPALTLFGLGADEERAEDGTVVKSSKTLPIVLIAVLAVTCLLFFLLFTPLYSVTTGDQPQLRTQTRTVSPFDKNELSGGDRLIIDSGTTPLQVARHIPPELLASGNLTVITASLPIARELGSHPGVHLILLGGVYLSAYDLVIGPQTIDNLRNLHADKLFLGTDGLTFTQGITTANVLEAEVDRAMVHASSEVIVVSDSSKIGVIGLVTIMPLTEIDKLVTDLDAPRDFVEELHEQGVEVTLV